MCLDGNNDDEIVAMVTELCTLRHDVCYFSEVAMVTTMLLLLRLIYRQPIISQYLIVWEKSHIM